MIRGAIDSVSPHEISGWLYAGENSLRGKKVLAFFQETCIGAGEVNEFRRDLADAGLGDGFLGFRFAITPPDLKRLGAVVVRLEGGDAAIVQKESQIVGRFDPPEVATGIGAGFDRGRSLQWMRGRGWLDQSQFDFLWYLDQLGVYNRMLSADEQAGTTGAQAGTIAEELLELFHMAEIVPIRQDVRTAAALADVLRKVVQIRILEPVLGVWSASPARVRIVEGSHREGSRRVASSSAEDVLRTSYVVGPNRLLFFNARCHVDGTIGNQGLTVFFANGPRG